MFSVHRSTSIPSKKTISASSRSTGIDAMTAGVFHSMNASYRPCRSATCVSESPDIVVHCWYSRNHCFAIIPNSAAARLSRRLKNQRELIQMTDALTSKLGDSVVILTGTRLLFASCCDICPICSEICARMLFVVWLSLGCSPTYCWTRNPASTAENKPAYIVILERSV